MLPQQPLAGVRDSFDSPLAILRHGAVGDATDQMIAPIWKLYPATSHAEQYVTNSRYCGNLLWQSSLTLQPPDGVYVGTAKAKADLIAAVERIGIVRL